MPRGAHQKVYPALKLSAGQVRLLTIHQPGDNHEARQKPATTLEASLRVVSLDNAPPYCAMSHTWGEQVLTHAIRVNGRLLSVTRNCWEALQFYRDHWSSTETVIDHGGRKAEEKLKAFQRRSTRELWVDQICIDQTDQGDKEDQILLMKRIYATANVVWAWTDDYTCEDVRYAALVGSWSKIIPEDLKASADWSVIDWPNLMLQIVLWGQHHSRGPRTESNMALVSASTLPAWIALMMLYMHPYFGRRWIIQELTFNPYTFVSRYNKLIQLELLAVASSYISNHYFELARLCSFLGKLPPWINHGHDALLSNVFALRIQRWKNRHQDQGHGHSFKTLGRIVFLLEYCDRAETSEPHDRFYAFRSMAPTDAVLPAPSYGATPQKVCVDYAAAFLRAGVLAPVFQLAGRAIGVFNNPPKTPDLPSWCPDWLQARRKAITNAYCGGEFWEQRTSDTIIFISDDFSILRLSVTVWDGIVAAQGCASPEPEPEESWRSWCQFIKDHDIQEPQTGDIDKFLSNVEIATDNDLFDFDPKAQSQNRAGFSAWDGTPFDKSQSQSRYFRERECLRFLVALSKLNNLSANFEAKITYLWMESRFALVACTHVLIITTQGQIGICSGFAQPGDPIILFKGCWLPVVVRLQADERYEVIGDSIFSEFPQQVGPIELQEDEVFEAEFV